MHETNFIHQPHAEKVPGSEEGNNPSPDPYKPTYLPEEEHLDSFPQEESPSVDTRVMSNWELNYQEMVEKITPDEEILSHEEARELAEVIQAGLAAGKRLLSSNLNAEQQRELSAQVEEGKAARDTLVVGNMRLAAWFVRATMDFHKEDRLAKGEAGQKGAVIRDLSTLAGGELDYSDRMQLATIGLIRASESWDPNKGRFSTIAMYSMEHELSKAMFRQQSPYWFSAAKAAEIRNFVNKKDELVSRLGHSPTPDEMAQAMDISPAHAVLLEELAHARQKVSFEEIEALWIENQNDATADGGDGPLNISDVLVDAGVSKSVVDEVALIDVEHRIDELLSTLDEREKQVLEMRFGFYGGQPMTLKEVGFEFNLSSERIRAIQASALTKLRMVARMDSGIQSLLDEEDPQMGKRSELPIGERIEATLGLTRATPYILDEERVAAEQKVEEKNRRYHPGRPYSLTELREMSEPGWMNDED